MPQLQVQVAVAKIAKYATEESGDTLEMIERPQGGISLVLVDGQRSGRAAKSISNIVARKAISLLGDGVRDGAVARAAHDYLRTMRGGKVSATLSIVSIDMQTQSVVISQNSHCPIVVIENDQMRLLDEPSQPVGIYTWTKPVISEFPITPNSYVIACTDGVLHAGRYCSQQIDLPVLVQELVEHKTHSAQSLADAILDRAVSNDQGRPHDDISVMVVAVLPPEPPIDPVRRMSVRFPIRIKGKASYGG